MGSVMKIRPLNEKLRKIYVYVFVFLLLHIYRRHLSKPVRKMCPIPDIPLKGKNVIIFSIKKFQVLIFEKIHITESYIIKILVNIWNHGKNL